MIIAVDSTIVTFALGHCLNSTNADEINFICNKLIKCTPQMQYTLTMCLLQDIGDWCKQNPDADYLREAPIKRLEECLRSHKKEFYRR